MTYEKYLERLIDEVFTEAATRWTWHELAKEAGVSYNTVWRLGTYQTKLPQLRTAYLLCKAVGRELPAVFKRQRHLKIAS